MDYKKKDGTLVREEWMEAVAEAAEADDLLGIVTAVQDHGEGEEDFATVPVTFSKSRLTAIEKAAERIGETSSDFIRNAVDKALLMA